MSKNNSKIHAIINENILFPLHKAIVLNINALLKNDNELYAIANSNILFHSCKLIAINNKHDIKEW